MRKIKGFKLSPRFKELGRRAKKAGLDLERLGFSASDLDKAYARMQPAVLFESFPKPDATEAPLSPMPGLAYSLILATLSEAFAVYRREAEAAQPEWAGVLAVVEELALEETVRFASALIEQEAAAEACELSPISPLSEPGALQTALGKLDGSKIAVSLAEDRLLPSASRVVSLSWLAKSKHSGKRK